MCSVENVFHNTLPETENEPLIPFDRFSDFNKLCNTAISIFKFIKRCKRIMEKPDLKQFAQSYLIKIIQLQAFNKEILRADGRIANPTRYEYDLVYARLIINDRHLQCKHLGVGTTESKLRLSEYWIPQARQSVKAMIFECYTCKKNSIILHSSTPSWQTCQS